MYENTVNHRGRMLDPISLEEVPQDQVAWLVLDNTVYSPASILRYIENWQESQEIEEDYRLTSASFRNWTPMCATRLERTQLYVLRCLLRERAS